MNSPQPFLLLTEAVNNLLQRCEVPASLTIEQCASTLAMSMTSFRRKLAQEESSYKLIQSKFLNEFCVHALLTKAIKIDDLAHKLGYSERATFERAFRQKFGITPSQFRELSIVDSDNRSGEKLIQIAENIPPMPDSCQQLILEKDQGGLDIKRVTDIIGQDPIFTGRILGQASKAIYGKTPVDMHEAISRNLGIGTVVNFAVIYAMKDALQAHVEQTIIDQYSQAFLMAPKFFQMMRKSAGIKVKFDINLTEQTLVFALLGIFLLSHKSANRHELMLHSLQGIDDLHSLNLHIKETMGISVFSASSLMLSLWHIDAGVIKQLNHLDKVSLQRVKGNGQDELILFMLSCLYHVAAGHENYGVLEQKAELLNIENFSEIKQLLSVLT
jgi:HD-like signal output (HDOD) protein/AraC-like DNA-binding protein